MKILYFDIETSPCIATVWGTGKQYIGADQIQKERVILTISYMWEEDTVPTILTFDQKLYDLTKFDDNSDKYILEKFMKIYKKADLAVAHNGRRFDRARIRARLVKYQMPDIAPVLFDDSYSFTKDIDFTSHKLDYIGRYLGVGRKTHTDYSLWVRVINGDKQALKEMGEYNSQDVILLRDVYRKTVAYAKSSINHSIFKEEKCCINPLCGSTSLRSNGIRFTGGGKYRRYQCQDCGTWMKVGVNSVVKPKQYLRRT